MLVLCLQSELVVIVYHKLSLRILYIMLLFKKFEGIVYLCLIISKCSIYFQNVCYRRLENI